jgi:hypothetical protein
MSRIVAHRAEMHEPPSARVHGDEAAQTESLALLYAEACRAIAIFIEWRHKVILLCTTTLALTLAAVSWAYKVGAGELVMAGALFASSAVAALCRRFDRRNEQLLKMCYATANECEADLVTRFTVTVNGTPRARKAPTGVWTRVTRSRDERAERRGATLDTEFDARHPLQWLSMQVPAWIPDTYGQLVPWACGLLSVVLLAGGMFCLLVALNQ